MLQLPLLIGLGHISSSVYCTVSRSDMHRFWAVLIDIEFSSLSLWWLTGNVQASYCSDRPCLLTTTMSRTSQVTKGGYIAWAWTKDKLSDCKHCFCCGIIKSTLNDLGGQAADHRGLLERRGILSAFMMSAWDKLNSKHRPTSLKYVWRLNMYSNTAKLEVTKDSLSPTGLWRWTYERKADNSRATGRQPLKRKKDKRRSGPNLFSTDLWMHFSM